MMREVLNLHVSKSSRLCRGKSVARRVLPLYLMAALLLPLAGGCGAARGRNSVPQPLAGRAVLNGFDGDSIRFWGDQNSEQTRAMAVERLRQLAAEPAASEPVQRGQPNATAPIRVLCLSAGGAEGAFSAGLLCGWTRSGNRPRFDAVTGVSTGSLLSAFAFAGPDYDEALHQAFTTISDPDVYKTRGFLGLFGADSVADTSPLAALLEKYVDDRMIERIAAEHRTGRRLFVTTTNLDAQRPVVWDMGAIANSGRPDRGALFRKVLLAAAAIPAVFPPVYFDVHVDGKPYDEMHVDGGITGQIFFAGYLLQLSEAQRSASAKIPVQAYVVVNYPNNPRWESIPATLVDIAGRSLRTLLRSQVDSDVFRLYAFVQRDGIAFNYLGIPDSYHPIPQAAHADVFDRKEMNQLFDIGYKLGSANPRWEPRPRGL